MLRNIRKLPYYARKAFREGMGWANAYPESLPRKAARVPLNQIYQLRKRLQVGRAACIYLTEGRSSVDGRRLRVAFLGDWRMDREPFIEHYEDFLFEKGSAVRKDLGTYSGSQRSQAERLAGQVDLIAALPNPAQPWTPPVGNWVLAPARMQMVFNFSPGETPPDFLRRIKHDPNALRVLDAGFRYHISHRRTDFHRFYQEMYLPTIQSHVDGYGEMVAEQDAEAVFQEHQSLLLVTDTKDRQVAGALTYRWHGKVYAFLKGAAQQESAECMKDALLACDLYGILWALGQGCRQYDAGFLLPFQTDPIYQEKEGWAGRAVKTPFHPEQLLLWAPEGAEAGLEWLRANPVHPPFGRTVGDVLAHDSHRAVHAQPDTERMVTVTGQSVDIQTPEQYQFESFGSFPYEERQVISHGLYDHAMAAIGPEYGSIYKPYSIFIRDGKQQVIGGLVGRFTWNYLHIDSLWVSPDHRGHDLGTRLMMMAEQSARSEGTHFITLETTSFEAIGFYPKLGYQVVGQIEDIPPGQTIYYLKKDLRG